MNQWLRLWHDMPTDPKFRTVARTCGQPLSSVVAVYVFMLADASANATERGRTLATDEDVASAMDLDEGAVAAIRQAMQGRVLEGNLLSGWEKRQPKREDNSAERSKAWRESKKTERDQTQATAEKRPDKDTDNTPISPKRERPLRSAALEVAATRKVNRELEPELWRRCCKASGHPLSMTGKDGSWAFEVSLIDQVEAA